MKISKTFKFDMALMFNIETSFLGCVNRKY